MQLSKVCLFFLLGLTSFQSSFAQNFGKINPENIEIVRDQWGVPHIFAPTDAEVAYGLAWANAEDAFKEMQDLLVIGKGMSGIQKGVEGVKADFFRHVIGARDLVDGEMDSYPADFLKYIDGYVQGINAFASSHKDQVLMRKLFPLTTEDVMTTYVMVLSSMTEASAAMEKIYTGQLDESYMQGLGSNAYAVNAAKSKDGKTMLCMNPHMRLIGTFSFYEAHLQSEEGLNMHGAIFHGGTSIFMGNNPNLGWGMTWNYFNRGDIYRLKMHPKKKHLYWYDNEWKQLEVKKVRLKVRIKGLNIPVKRKVYRNMHGPVLNSSENKDEFYAFRYPAFMSANGPLQWYRMNKTTNLKEFKSALEVMGISLFNIVYADKEDNIYFVSYGQVPYREDSIAKMKVLPGDDSRYVWQRIHTLNELPQEENPECNYVYNTNNSPFFATCEENNTLKLELKDYLDARPGQNNRAVVLHDFMEEHAQLDFEEFQSIKFDHSYSTASYLMKQLRPFFELDVEKYPEVKDILTLFQQWSGVANPDDVSSTVVMVITDLLFRDKGYNDKQFLQGFRVSEADFIDCVRNAKEWFLKYYNKVDVPLKEVFICQKGDSTFSSPGFPDALAANYGVRKKDKYVVRSGDTYTQFVVFGKDGVEEMRTLVPFGNSNHPESPFYLNQSEMFRAGQTKKMTLNKRDIYEDASSIYNPK